MGFSFRSEPHAPAARRSRCRTAPGSLGGIERRSPDPLPGSASGYTMTVGGLDDKAEKTRRLVSSPPGRSTASSSSPIAPIRSTEVGANRSSAAAQAPARVRAETEGPDCWSEVVRAGEDQGHAQLVWTKGYGVITFVSTPTGSPPWSRSGPSLRQLPRRRPAQGGHHAAQHAGRRAALSYGDARRRLPARSLRS